MKVLLFYHFVQIKKPEVLVEQMRKFCKTNRLKGRIIITKDGINGTVGGENLHCEAYKTYMLAKPKFHNIWFKEQQIEHNPFPRMQIRTRKELVTLRLPAQPNDGGKHIDPNEVNELAKNANTVFFDTRNEIESRIGHFKDSIKPNMKTFRDLPKVIKEHKNELKGKNIIMYCTGGIRCEIGTAIMKNLIPDAQVYQINGGIYNYCQSKNNQLWQGTCYVFDDRINIGWDENGNHIDYTDLPANKIVSNCEFCKMKCARVVNDERYLHRVERVCCQDCDKKHDISRLRTKEERQTIKKQNREK